MNSDEHEESSRIAGTKYRTQTADGGCVGCRVLLLLLGSITLECLAVVDDGQYPSVPAKVAKLGNRQIVVMVPD